ncbi:hypothetical protein Pla123a_31020 [Posidoniimonas polymericola]|uniref:VWFA domain-containing protein n=1 Tax=Posidoniimonas polymericola TaxID=2528002 RepID=A0A5C5YL44_9BACT|nr:vWA domain-containing protein [Posidoniimonas polymericola]TWT75592.1 hypothetical protein Pla123a_31020 [Posidoniimonas polymericola]
MKPDEAQQPPEASPPRARFGPSGRPAGRRRRLLFAWSSATAALLLVLVFATTLLSPPAPVSLMTVGAHYAENLATPHNARGWNGLETLCRLGAQSESFRLAGQSLLHADATPLPADRCFEWPAAVKKLTGDTAVLVVSAHGGGDDQGPFLLRSEATAADEPTTRLRVADLLAALRKSPAEQHKLVVFDATSQFGMARLGLLQNRFAAELAKLDPEIQSIPNLVFVCASSDGERSWPAAGGGATLFLQTFIEGLRGAAPDPDANGRLSGGELVSFVRTGVADRVATRNRREQNVLVLPAGAEGASRLDAMDLALVNKHYQPPGPAKAVSDVAQFSAPWDRLRVLGQQLEEPATTAPISWRRYRRLLIRHEQLLAAGAPKLAADIAQLIDAAGGDLQAIASDLRQQFDPVQLPAAASAGPIKAEPIVEKLLAAGPAAARAAWGKQQEAVPADQLPGLRRRVYDLLLDRFAESPSARLAETAAYLKAIDAPDAPRPAEAHLVVMLEQGLPTGREASRWDQPLRQAVATRRHAERTLRGMGLAKSRVAPMLDSWLRTPFEQADQRRRDGEDLLFSGDEYLPRALTALAEADAAYLSLRRDADALAHAIIVRDRSFDLLPFYSDAIGMLLQASEDDRDDFQRLAKPLESAWTCAHALSELIESERPLRHDQAGLPKDLAKHSGELEKRLATLRSAMRAWQADLVERSGPSFWNNRDAALLAPELDDSQRVRLLSVTPPAFGDAMRTDRAAMDALAGLPEWRRTESVRRALLAVAAIGSERYEEGAHQHNRFDEVAKQLQDEHADLGGVLAGIETDLAKVYKTCQLRLVHASELVRNGLQNDAGFDQLRQAAEIERGLAPGVDAKPGLGPIEQLQKVRRFRLLLANARRAVTDGWNADPDASAPYSQRVAAAYLARADRLIPGLSDTQELWQQSKAAVSIGIQSPQRIDLVSALGPATAYEVCGDLSGIAAVDVTGGAVVVSKAPAAGKRQAYPVNGRAGLAAPRLIVEAPSLLAAVDPVAPAAETHPIQIHAWLRGHTATIETPVVVHRRPDAADFRPPPPKQAALSLVASDAVRGRLRHGGAVAFVLDASGSMAPTGDPAASKYVQAVEALRAMLAETPAGVRVSVWVFGQAVGPQKTVDNAESTITQVLSPVEWDPTNRDLLDRIAAGLAYPRVQPWNESPLGRALLTAAGDFRGVSGPRAVIAITDGYDNRLESDAAANPKKLPLGGLVKQQLAGTDIALQVIGFRVAPQEQADARKQFKFLASLSPPGRWWEASQRSELDAALRAALGGGRADAVAKVSPLGAADDLLAEVEIQTPSDSPATTPLSAGAYRLDLVAAAPGSPESRVSVRGGDLLVLRLTSAAKGLTLTPDTQAGLPRHTMGVQENDAWRVRLLQRRRLPSHATAQLIALERKRSPSAPPEQTLRVTHPEHLWIACGDDADGAIDWTPVYGYPVSCWEVTCAPESSASTGPLQLWWTVPGQELSSLSLRRKEDFQQPADLAGRAWDLQGLAVKIERAAVESCVLPDEQGRPTRQDSLVIEVACQRPCLISVAGVDAAGRQQRVFHDAERSVARFWPVSAEQTAETLQGVTIVTLDDLKRFAQDQQQSLTFERLPAASPSEPRPLPAAGWLGASAN